MRTYRLKIWTGPTAAVELGRRVRRAGVRVPTTGTEHIYVNAQGTDCADAENNFRAKLHKKYKKDFGLRSSSCTLKRKRK